jgi:hypothetical protein
VSGAAGPQTEGMDIGTWTLVIGAMFGLAMTAFGAAVLITGNVPAKTAQAFPRVRDAGLYHLLFGLALILVVAGMNMPGGLPGTLAAVLAVAMVVLAVVRYRPRKRKTE